MYFFIPFKKPNAFRFPNFVFLIDRVSLDLDPAKITVIG